MKVLKNYVLIEQTMTKKDTRVILLNKSKDEDKYDYSFKVIQKGADCGDDFKVGDIPVFNKHVSFQGVKSIFKTEERMVIHTIIHESEIIGIDD